jgi:hypothetical protein
MPPREVLCLNDVRPDISGPWLPDLFGRPLARPNLQAGDMEPGNAIAIWRGRWILTGGLLLLAMVGVGVAMVFLPRTYQSSASVMLLDSRYGSTATGGNPYLNFSASLTLTADAVSRQVMDPQTASSLASHGFLGSYTVAMPTYSTSTVGSVLLVTVTSDGTAGVENTLNGVISAIRASLAGLQSGIPTADRIQLVVLAPAVSPTLDGTHTVRSVAIVAGFGLLVAFGVPWMLDAQVRRHFDAGRYPIDENAWGSSDEDAIRDDLPSGNGAWARGAPPGPPRP